jgi:hypothetical protein
MPDRIILAQLQNLLCHTKAAKTSYLETELLYEEADPTNISKTNKSHTKRKGKFEATTGGVAPIVTLIGALQTDYQSMRCLIPYHNTIRVTLTRNPDELLLNKEPYIPPKDEDGKTITPIAVQPPDPNTYHLILKNVSMMVRTPLLSDFCFQMQSKRFAGGAVAKGYHYSNKLVKFQIPIGIESWISPPILPNEQGVKMFACFYDAATVRGTMDTQINSFKKPPNLTCVQVLLDRHDVNYFGTVESQTLKTGLDVYLFAHLFHVTQTMGVNDPYTLSLETFNKDAFIVSADFSCSSSSTEDKLALVRPGARQIQLTYALPTETVTDLYAWVISPALTTFGPDLQPVSVHQKT